MKDILNLLFYKDINKFLKNQNFEYLAVEEDEEVIVNPLPPIFNEYSVILKEYLCYDYDKLSEVNKEIYKNRFKRLKKVRDNQYKEDVKLYKFQKK